LLIAANAARSAELSTPSIILRMLHCIIDPILERGAGGSLSLPRTPCWGFRPLQYVGDTAALTTRCFKARAERPMPSTRNIPPGVVHQEQCLAKRCFETPEQRWPIVRSLPRDRSWSVGCRSRTPKMQVPSVQYSFASFGR